PVDDHLLAEEHPRIEAADLRDAEEALLHPGDDEGDLVHVRGEHEGRPCGRTVSRGLSAPQRDEVSYRVDPHLMRVLTEPSADDAADPGLVSRRPPRLAELPQQAGGFHG